MGYKYTNAVFSAILPGKPTEALAMKAILNAIAWFANNKTGLCFPSLALIGRVAGCNRDTVRKYLPKLIKLGLVKVAGERATKNGAVNVLWVNLAALEKLGKVMQPRDADVPDTPTNDPESCDGALGPAYRDGTLPVGDDDQGFETPPTGGLSHPVPGVSDTQGGGLSHPESVIDLEFQSVIEQSNQIKSADVTLSLHSNPANPSQTPRSTTRDSVPNPAGDFSPPEPPGSPVSTIGDSPRSAAPRKQEPKPTAPRCRKCRGPVKNNKIDGVCLKCGFDPNYRETPFVEFEERGRHKWPPRNERTSDSLCLNGCGVPYGESKYLPDSRYCWKADAANA